MSPLLKKKNLKFLPKSDLARYCLASGIVAALVMLFVFMIHENTLVFGKLTVLRMDLYHQYGPLFTELYDRIVNGYSTVYSWTSGLGSSFTGNLLNYCCSPFALIILLTGHTNMPEAIALMMLLKACFSAVSFTYYINKTNRKTRVESIAFGLLYAFCGYFVAFSWNIMWLDAMAVFPLVMLGIEKIIQRNRPYLYIGCLVYTMITNYYMAYMVCILSVIYFLYYYFGRYSLGEKIDKDEPVNTSVTEAVEVIPEDSGVVTATVHVKKVKTPLMQRRFWRTGMTFALSSFLCFLISAACLIPVFHCLQTSSATSGTMPTDVKYYFGFFDFLANHLPGLETTIRSSGDDVLPNVYCGMLTILLIPLYFMNEKIAGRKKVVAAVLLGVFYLGFSINYLNFFWHGMHMPNDLPYRYSFAYSFILLTLAYQAFINIKNFNKKTVVGVGLVVMMFVVLVHKLGSKNADLTTVNLSFIFTAVYCVFLGMMLSKKTRKSVLSVMLIIIVVAELGIANTSHYTMQQPKDAYVSDYKDYQAIKSDTESSDTELFYRTELSKLRTRMDPSWYGYNGVSVFSSMAYEHVAKLMEKLGMFGNNINSYTYYPQTPVFNSMVSLRYIYDKDNLINNKDTYTKQKENSVFTSYKYNYYLPLGYSVASSVLDWDTSSDNPFEVQNNYIKSATGIKENCLELVEATDVQTDNISAISIDSVNNGTTFSAYKVTNGNSGTVTVYIDVEEAGDYYVYAGSTKLSSIQFTADNFSYNYVSSAIQPFTINVGYQKEGSQIEVKYTVDAANDSGTLTFVAAKLNEDNFKKAYNKLSKNTMNLTEFGETYLEGTVTIPEGDNLLYTSIPYDESWVVTIDGKQAVYSDENNEGGEIVKVGEALTGLRLKSGTHTIAFEYKLKGAKQGMGLTVIGLAILALLIVWELVIKKKNLLKKSPLLFEEITKWKN